MKLKGFFAPGEWHRPCLASLVVSCAGLAMAATYTMSSSGDIPMVDGAYSFADGDTLVVDVPTTNTTPIRMNGDLTISGTEMICQNGEVSGTGDLRFSIVGKTSFLSAPFTSTGSLRVDLGGKICTNILANSF